MNESSYNPIVHVTPGLDLDGVPGHPSTPTPVPLWTHGTAVLAVATVVTGISLAVTPWLYVAAVLVLLARATAGRFARGLRSGAIVPWEIDAAFHAAIVGWFAPVIGLPLHALIHGGGTRTWVGVGVGGFLWLVTTSRTYSATRRWVTWRTNPRQLLIEAENEAVNRGRDGIN